MTQPVPQGYHTVTPYLVVSDAAAAITFYGQAFGAVERGRFTHHDRIAHAELDIGDSRVMLADECPEMGALAPKSRGSAPMALYLYVEDVDRVVNSAVAAGATLVRPVEDQFYGDRAGRIADPFGYHWDVATRKEEVSAEELRRRATARFGE